MAGFHYKMNGSDPLYGITSFVLFVARIQETSRKPLSRQDAGPGRDRPYDGGRKLVLLVEACR